MSVWKTLGGAVSSVGKFLTTPVQRPQIATPPSFQRTYDIKKMIDKRIDNEFSRALEKTERGIKGYFREEKQRAAEWKEAGFRKQIQEFVYPEEISRMPRNQVESLKRVGKELFTPQRDKLNQQQIEMNRQGLKKVKKFLEPGFKAVAVSVTDPAQTISQVAYERGLKPAGEFVYEDVVKPAGEFVYEEVAKPTAKFLKPGIDASLEVPRLITKGAGVVSQVVDETAKMPTREWDEWQMANTMSPESLKAIGKEYLIDSPYVGAPEPDKMSYSEYYEDIYKPQRLKQEVDINIEETKARLAAQEEVGPSYKSYAEKYGLPTGDEMQDWAEEEIEPQIQEIEAWQKQQKDLALSDDQITQEEADRINRGTQERIDKAIDIVQIRAKEKYESEWDTALKKVGESPFGPALERKYKKSYYENLPLKTELQRYGIEAEKIFVPKTFTEASILSASVIGAGLGAVSWIPKITAITTSAQTISAGRVAVSILGATQKFVVPAFAIFTAFAGVGGKDNVWKIGDVRIRGKAFDPYTSKGERALWKGIGTVSAISLASQLAQTNYLKTGIERTGKARYKQTTDEYISMRTGQKYTKWPKHLPLKENISAEDVSKAFSKLNKAEKKIIIQKALVKSIPSYARKEIVNTAVWKFGTDAQRLKLILGETTPQKILKEILKGEQWPKVKVSSLLTKGSIPKGVSVAKSKIPIYEWEKFKITPRGGEIGRIVETRKFKVFGVTVRTYEKSLLKAVGSSSGKLNYFSLEPKTGQTLITKSGRGVTIKWIKLAKEAPRVTSPKYTFFGKGAVKGKEFRSVVDFFKVKGSGDYTKTGFKAVTFGKVTGKSSPLMLREYRIGPTSKVPSFKVTEQRTWLYKTTARSDKSISKELAGLFGRQTAFRFKGAKPKGMVYRMFPGKELPKVKVFVQDRWVKPPTDESLLWVSKLKKPTGGLFTTAILDKPTTLPDYTTRVKGVETFLVPKGSELKGYSTPITQFMQASTSAQAKGIVSRIGPGFLWAKSFKFIAPVIKTKSRFDLKLSPQSIQINRQSIDIIARSRIDMVQRQDLRLRQQQRQRLRTTQVQQQVQVPQVVVPVLQTRPRTVPENIPRIVPIPFLPNFTSELPDRPFLRKKPKQRAVPTYSTFVRRRGEWFILGKPEPRGKALRKGAKYALTTLGASFKVAPTGKKVKGLKDIKFKPSTRFFRGPKQKGEGLIFIQRGGAEPIYVRGGRLATRGERKEIQFFRRQPRGTPRAIKILGG